MWWGTKKTHHQNVSIQSRDTKSAKNHQSKVELQERINNRERERERERAREYSPFWMGKILIEWKGEYQIFIANEIGKRGVKKKKKRMKGWRNCKVNVIE